MRINAGLAGGIIFASEYCPDDDDDDDRDSETTLQLDGGVSLLPTFYQSRQSHNKYGESRQEHHASDNEDDDGAVTSREGSSTYIPKPSFHHLHHSSLSPVTQ